MELGRISTFYKITKVLGWLAVISGLIVLFIFNVVILADISIDFWNLTSILLFISFCSAMITLFNKHHRSLGIWGLSIVSFCILFIFFTFGLMWVVVPFP